MGTRNPHRFFLRLKFSWFQNGNRVACPGYPPSPLVFWNHRVSGKSGKNIRAAITCGENLEPQGLRPHPATSPNRHYCERLDDDQAKLLWAARSDVTRLQIQLWKCRNFTLRGSSSKPAHSVNPLLRISPVHSQHVPFTAGSTSSRFSPEFRSSPAASITMVDRF